MKKQVIVIHGGDTFENDEKYLKFLRDFEIDIKYYTKSGTDWKPWLREALPKDYQVIVPAMPNKNNAKYSEWKLWFEKLFPFIDNDIILVGHSLGASFLIKYLSENEFPKKIEGVFLVSGVFDKDDDGYTLESFVLPKKLDLQTENIYFYHSKDDPVVPFSALENFMKVFPNAHVRIFEDRQHINQEKFPELVEDIISL